MMPSTPPHDSDNDEVDPNAVQLLLVATFNGLCHALAALARRGQLSEEEIEAMVDAMTDPLDDAACRDDSMIDCARGQVESILAKALASSRTQAGRI